MVETTREQWADLMGGDVPSDSASFAQGGVSFNDAMYLANAANNAFASAMPTGASFDLPTEEQWEYAARGGVNKDDFAYAGGNDPDDVALWGGVTEVPGQVATRKPNSLGLYDMSGNACEWTKSYYSSSYDSSPDYTFRVYRGGGIEVRPNSVRELRVSHRQRDIERRALKYYGVRLVLNVKEVVAPPTSISNGCLPNGGRYGLSIRNAKIVIDAPDGRTYDLCGRRL